MIPYIHTCMLSSAVGTNCLISFGVVRNAVMVIRQGEMRQDHLGTILGKSRERA